MPDVVGMKLTGELPLGTTATDLVLTVTQMLRKKGVVDKFVEFYGPGLSCAGPRRPRHDRQHGAGVRRHDGLLPGGRRDAPLSRADRPGAAQVRAGERYCKEQGLFRTDATPDPEFTATLELDLSHGRAEPRRARAARRISCRSRELKRNFIVNLPGS